MMKRSSASERGRTRKDWFAVIMAGGRGERFWPLSRGATPKQLLRLLGDRSLLQLAVDRVLPLVPKENIFVITNRVQLPEVRRQLRGLPRANLVAEPLVRDTAAAVALGVALVSSRCGDGVMAVLPADHVITGVERFQRVLADGMGMARVSKAIVTIGIPPTEPATGYGYIRMGGRVSASAIGVKGMRTTFHRVEQFVEKPPLAKAVEYLEGGRHRWNAGMFLWSCETVFEGLRQHQPVLHEACRRWCAAASHPTKLARVLARDYPELPRVSIDYALMERAEGVMVAEGDFGWDDLGSWSALMRHLKADPAGNRIVGEAVLVDSGGNLVFDARTKGRTPIALVGLRDTVCVQTDDALLLAQVSETQKVKELVKLLGAKPCWQRLI